MSLRDPVVREFGAKLQLTAAALNCSSQKELALAFRRANPATAFELGPSYRWMQDRALPRSHHVYDEWAALLALDRPAEWLLGCSAPEFAALLAARHGLDAVSLWARAGLGAPHLPGNGATALPEDDPTCGVYACYSHAQSPYFRGRIIRGTLSIAPAARRGDAPVATYSQQLPGGPAYAVGPVQLRSSALCAMLVPPDPSFAPVSLSVFRPTPPASVLAGILLGVTAVSPGLQTPYATRLAALRVPLGVAAAQAGNRYLTPEEWPPGRELEALGVVPTAELEERLTRFVTGGGGTTGDNLSALEHVSLVEACDRAWLGARQAAEPPSLVQRGGNATAESW